MRTGLWLLAALLVACASVTEPPLPPSPETPAPLPVTLPSTQLPPNATSTVAPTQPPAPTVEPTPTPTPAPALRQLTVGGCCAQPFFSPDGSQIWFIDHPAPELPAGIWGINLSGGEPQFISDRPGYYSRDGQYIVYPENFQTYIQNVATGERWEPPLTDGRFVSISPDSSLIAWQVNSSVFNFDGRAVDVWVADLAGSNPRQVIRLVGGGLNTWFPDNQRLLVTTRDSAGADPQLAILNILDGSLTPLVQAFNLRGSALSPGGGWIAYQIAFSGDPARDGLWLMSTDGALNTRLDIYGSYRWRAEGQLLIIPLEPGSSPQSNRLLQFDTATNALTPLTDPALLPFRIANGDWNISPDGKLVLFQSADDRNLWLLTLP